MKPKTYGMFSDKGDAQVAKVVAKARANKLPFGKVLKLLRTECDSEALDTDVRERVHLELYGKCKGGGYVALIQEDAS